MSETPEPSAPPARRVALAAREDGLPSAIGRYEIRRRLGEGAMGRVLLAHDPILDRDVAIKHLRDDLRIPRDMRAGLLVRMRHEARAAARVAHPNLVTLHDMGEDPELGLYLVFEYVRGPTLKQRIDEGPIPPNELAVLARQLGDALTCAHEAGVLHRDIKPDNVILSRTGAKLADFGIARVPDSTLTQVGGLLGTPAYSAPETFRESSFSEKSDQFSLAASLYEALSGQRAFPGDDSVSVTSRIANDPPEPIAVALGLSLAVDEVLGRALAKKPAARFSSCNAFGSALAAALGAPEAAVPPRGRPLPAAPAERKAGQILLGAAIVAATAALIARTATRAPTEDPDTSAPSASSLASASAATTARRRAPLPRPRGPRPSSTEALDASAPSPAKAEPPDAGGEAAPPPRPSSSGDVPRP